MFLLYWRSPVSPAIGPTPHNSYEKIILIALLATAQLLSAQTLVNDPAHSKLGFEAIHLSLSHIEGHFGDFSVSLDFAKEDFSDAKIVLIAQIASINTRVAQRDTHLKSPDFFDAEKFPEMKFTSTAFRRVIGNQYRLEGDLLLHGITKKVTLNATYNGSVINPMSKQKTHGFSVEGVLKKSDFGVGLTFPEFVVGDEIKITADLEFPVSNQN